MDDLISRQAAIDALKNRWKKTRNYEGIGDDIAEECELYLKQVPSAQPETNCSEIPNNSDTIYRQDAIDALGEGAMVNYQAAGHGNGLIKAIDVIKGLPSAQPTLCGYNMEHLELIARVLQRENLPPERITEVLTDIGRIVAIVKDELEQALRKQAIERLIRLTGCKTNEEITARMDASVTDSEGWLGGVAACIDELEDMQGEWEAKK